MIHNYYGIKDNLADLFYNPFKEQNDATALRFFKESVNDKRNDVMYHNPGDYDLYKIGEFETTTGEFNPKLVKLTNGRSLKEETNGNSKDTV